MKKISTHLFLLIILVSLSSIANAQLVEISPYIGHRVGGKINTDDPATGSLLVPNLDISNTAVFGLIADINVSDKFQISIAADRQSTELQEDPRDGNPEIKRFDLTVNYLQGGVTIQHPNRPLTAFVSLLAGVAFLDPKQEFDNTMRGSGSLIAGGKFYFGERFGVRLQTRVFSTSLGSDRDLFCSQNSEDETCYRLVDDTFMTQVDFSIGFTILF